MEKQISDKKVKKFLDDFGKLKPVEALGMATLLGVKIYKPGQENKDRIDKEYRDGEDIIADTVENYFNLNHDQRRKIDKIFKRTLKK